MGYLDLLIVVYLPDWTFRVVIKGKDRSVLQQGAEAALAFKALRDHVQAHVNFQGPDAHLSVEVQKIEFHEIPAQALEFDGTKE